MPQPQYSPDLAPAEYFFFPKLKTPKTEKRFAMIEEIKEKSKQWLLAMPESAFQKCFEDWKKNGGISILHLRGVTLKRTRRQINK